jgi:methylenetetrahydrofolate reductase (NADPH)
VFDLDSIQLLEVARQLSTGIDMNGHPLVPPFPRYCLGAVVNPGADPLEPEIIKMEKKVDAGAEFFQTQGVFDVALFERFMSAVRHISVPVIAGIIVLKSAKMARYMNEHVAGVFVPEQLIQEMESTQDKEAQAVEIASRIINGVKSLCRGVHIMPLGRQRLLGRILDASELY